MTSLAEQYRAERRAVSGSAIYNPAPAPAPKRNLYEGSTPYGGLASYSAKAPTSRYLPKAGESPHDYKVRLQGVGLVHLAENLPEAELAQVAEAYNQAVTALEAGPGSHTELRQRLASRTTGTDIGIMGASAEQRAVAVGSRFGGRELA